MMLPVVDTVVPVGPEDEEAGHGPEPGVQPAGAKGGPVRGLVERAEDEGEHVAVGDQQRQGPAGAAETPEEHPGDRERAQVDRGAAERGPVGARHEGIQLLAGELVRGETDERVVDHESPPGPVGRFRYYPGLARLRYDPASDAEAAP